MAKVALLVGVSEYEPGLCPLPSAIHDVEAMQQVLTNPQMGAFANSDVTVLQNPSRHVMEAAIFHLYNNRQKDDLVLLYFSGHGVVNDRGEFYFASRDTCKDQGQLVPITAVEAKFVQQWMQNSKSQQKVIILDSCFSAAFARGMAAKDSGSVNPGRLLGGNGTAILTASTAIEFALAKEGLDLSIYTHYLVEGIKTGAADRDNDGSISVSELHDYAKSKVQEVAPAMTPQFYPVKEGFKILLAKSPQDDSRLKYRKEAEQRCNEGRFSITARKLLKLRRHALGISDEDAEAIEAEVLKPYHEYQRKLQDYQTTLQDCLQEETTLSDATLKDLIDYRKLLALKMEDAAVIEQDLLGNP